jgi:cell wall-associated NlpC family hydrolase
MRFAQVDNPPMELFRLPGRRTRPAVLALALAVLAVPARAAPGRAGPTTLAGARAEAARLQQEVARLDLKVETLAEAHTAAQARLDGLIQAAHRHQEALERSEQALQATRAAYAGDVRDLYTRGPLVPLELVLAAGDFHELAVAAGVAGGVIDRDVRAQVRAAPGPAGGGPAGPGRGGRGQGPGAGVRRPRRRPRPQPDGRGRRPHRARPGGQAVPLGATGPASFDCSGLARFAYADAGLSLPRTSRQQWSAGRHVRVADLRPGDLVF